MHASMAKVLCMNDAEVEGLCKDFTWEHEVCGERQTHVLKARRPADGASRALLGALQCEPGGRV